MIQRLRESIKDQNCDKVALPGELYEHSQSTGHDWIFIDCLKWALACDKIELPSDLNLGHLAGLLASQLTKKVTQMGALVKFELRSDEDDAQLSTEQKKQKLLQSKALGRSVDSILMNILHYLRVITSVVEQVKNFSPLQSVQ